jgi:hypothetical protein
MRKNECIKQGQVAHYIPHDHTLPSTQRPWIRYLKHENWLSEKSLPWAVTPETVTNT